MQITIKKTTPTPELKKLWKEWEEFEKNNPGLEWDKRALYHPEERLFEEGDDVILASSEDTIYIDYFVDTYKPRILYKTKKGNWISKRTLFDKWYCLKPNPSANYYEDMYPRTLINKGVKIEQGTIYDENTDRAFEAWLFLKDTPFHFDTVDKVYVEEGEWRPSNKNMTQEVNNFILLIAD